MCGGLDDAGHWLLGCQDENHLEGPAKDRLLGWRQVVGPRVGWVGPPAGGGKEASAVADGPRRRTHGKKRGSWQTLFCPVVRFRERHPAGVFVETRNGFPVPPGTIRFAKNARLYSDGSAKYVGTSFANAACSVVEKVPAGSARVGGAGCAAG